METTQALERLNMRRRENSFLIRTLENESNAERYFCGDSAAVLFCILEVIVFTFTPIT